VFRAYDATRERLVAVKLFKLDLPPERVHQLVAELERLVAARLDYPSLVAPVGTGIVGVAAYLAQDYVAAESLDLAVREYGPAPPADAVRVAAQLAGALDFAATVRIAHGALHPRDVLLSSEETRLTGVGVAHALERVGVTPPVRRPYSAPERIAGSEWDRRADVFSLAALMHELMWGRRPTGIGGQAADSLTEIAGGDLPALRDAFARALAENPADRFETALEFVEALNAAFPNVRLVVPDPQSAVRNPQSRAARAEERRLPLDGDQDRTPVAPAAEVAAAVRHAVPHVEPVEPVDLPIAAIDAAEEQRYRDAEVAPSLIDSESPIADRRSAMDDPQSAIVDPQSAIHNPQLFESAFEPSRSAVWPLVLAVGLGLAVGFAGGYGVGTHSRPDSTAVAVAPTAASRTPDAAPTPAAPTAAPPAPAASGREFTENAVAPAPKPAAPAPQSAIANPQSAIANPQSAIASPQSAIRNPQSAIREQSRPPARSFDAGWRPRRDRRPRRRADACRRSRFGARTAPRARHARRLRRRRTAHRHHTGAAGAGDDVRAGAAIGPAGRCGGDAGDGGPLRRDADRRLAAGGRQSVCGRQARRHDADVDAGRPRRRACGPHRARRLSPLVLVCASRGGGAE
jgi:serine/threonine-protein kinase